MILTSPWGSSRRSPWGSAWRSSWRSPRTTSRRSSLRRSHTLGEGERLLGDFLNTQIGISYLFVRKKKYLKI